MHNAPPNDQLKPAATSNSSCTACHPRFRQPEALQAHTHHQPSGHGSQCYNCHMPHTSYALFKAIRSHQIDSPRVTPTGPHTRPNACNLCHLDRTLQWTSEHLTNWYDQPPVELDGRDRNVAAGLHWALAGDAGQRAIATWHFGWEPARETAGTDWIQPRLSHALLDPYPAVRWIAWQSLKSLPAVAPFDYDFDGTPEHQQAVVERLTAPAQTRPIPVGQPGHRPQLLVQPDGRIDPKRLESLIRSRDNRQVEIYE